MEHNIAAPWVTVRFGSLAAEYPRTSPILATCGPSSPVRPIMITISFQGGVDAMRIARFPFGPSLCVCPTTAFSFKFGVRVIVYHNKP